MNAIVPRATVASIVAHRNRALALFGEAHNRLAAASSAITVAHKALAVACPGRNSYNFSSNAAKAAFLRGLKVPDRADFLATARRLADIEVWSHIIEITDLERLMDRTAKDQLRRDLLADPPEPTVENIYATLQHFAADSGMIFRRGIAAAFSELDRRFRSHDGFKIGSRVILDRAFDDSGQWNFYTRKRDVLTDIERTFYVLDDECQPAYGDVVHAIDNARRGAWGARQTEVESRYFRVRVFQNGNMHLWFTRRDLVEQVNKLLAEHYGEVIGDARTNEDSDLFRQKTSPARRWGFFPTPDDAADTIIADAYLYRAPDKPPLRVLEPSAGTGQLARRCVEKGAIVDCVEVQPQLADQLQAYGIYNRVTCADFLVTTPDPDRLYDRIVMNPPFDLERDVDHVVHALDFLAPNGLLVAIMSAGTEFRETKKAARFRTHMNRLNARWRDLPAGSFASVGTYVNTLYVSVWKNGRRSH